MNAEPRGSTRRLRIRIDVVLLTLLATAFGLFAWQTHSRVRALEIALSRIALDETGSLSAEESPPTDLVLDPVATEGAGFLGSADAPVTLVYFTDYQCGFCKRFTDETLPELVQAEVRTGRLRIVARDLPLFPRSGSAAIATRCAGEQGRYWEYHHALFARQPSVSDAALQAVADSLGLSRRRFTECRADERVARAVREDETAAHRAGIRGTPAFVLGRTPAEGPLHGRAILGALPAEIFRSAIANALAGPASPAGARASR